MSSLLIQNGQLVTEQGIDRVDIFIKNKVIEKIEPVNELTSKQVNVSCNETIDATDLLIFPGLIDCHVHFREPGMEEAEDMESGSQAALAGGVTTVCEMPNTDPPTCTLDALMDKLERAKRIKDVDIRSFFNVSTEEHLDELAKINPDDICGVKIYFDHSTGNLGANRDAIEGAFKLCTDRGIVIVGHCEDAEINDQAKQANTETTIDAHSEIRPPESEAKAIEEGIALSKKYGTKFHVAHLSTKQGLDIIRAAKTDNQNITCEVAPHHLFLSTDDYDHLGTLGKMNPPLRTPDHCEVLWEGIKDGTIDCIATDHAPHTIESKQCHTEAARSMTPLDSPSGVPGVETMLPLLLSAASNNNPNPRHPNTLIPVLSEVEGLQYSDILRLCFNGPNQIFSLGKPGIQPGKPADILLVNPKETWAIHGKDLHSKCGWTPYEGWEVTGKVERVIR